MKPSDPAITPFDSTANLIGTANAYNTGERQRVQPALFVDDCVGLVIHSA